MSDGLPTDEQLERIRAGVQRRLTRRRTVARSVAGGSVAVVLVVGGFALLPHLSLTSSSGAGSSAGKAPPSVVVECHGATTFSARAARSGLPESAIAACTADAYSGAKAPAEGSDTSASRPTPTATPEPTVCVGEDGRLEVFLSTPTVCAEHDLEPYEH